MAVSPKDGATLSTYRRIATQDHVKAIRWKQDNLTAIAAVAQKALIGEENGKLLFRDMNGRSFKMGFGGWLVQYPDGRVNVMTHSCFDFGYEKVAIN